MEWCSEEEEIVHDGIIQINFCAELIVLLNSHSVCVSMFFSISVSLVRLIIAPVLTGMQFNPATIFTWRTSSSDSA